MASKFVPLEEAAKLLGVPTEKLVEMRSNGELRGFRDGASWKFPQDEIDRLAADGIVGAFESGSAIMSNESLEDGSDLEIGSEPLSEGSDVALIANTDSASEIQIITNLESGDNLLGSDPSALDLNLGSEPQTGSEPKTGGEPQSSITPASDDDLVLIDESSAPAELPPDSSPGELDLADGLSLSSPPQEVDLSVDLSLGGDTPSDGMDIDLSLADEAASDGNELNLGAPEPSTGGSDLNLSDEGKVEVSDSAINPPEISLGPDSDGMDLNLKEESDEEIDLSLASPKGSGNDVLSELDLMSAEQGGSSDLIRGDSGSVLGSGSGISGISGVGSAIGDAMDDDDLVISDDDDDLVLGSAGSDVSVVGDSGINLMSPSDSGLSLESEPLDLAGSSISALDLGSEGTDRTPGSGGSRGVGSSGSLVDFKADEEFQLSPSGIGLDVDDDSGSQVIEVEDSESFSGAMDLGEGEMLSADAGLAVDPETGEGRGWAQRNELIADDAMGIDDASIVADPVEEEPVLEAAPAPAAAAPTLGYEVPYNVWNVMSLAGILMMLTFGGMLMTDLVRNLWTYNESTSAVSSLTEAILNAVGMNS